MRAVWCSEYCSPGELRVTEVPEPVAGPGQVLIDVAAAGINFPDSLIIQGKYQVKPPLPFVPGFELAGRVRAVGAGVSGLAPGMLVAAHPMAGGGFAECAAVEAGRVFPIPDTLDDVTAAGFLIAYGTAQHALKDRGRLQPGETLLVLGAAGGIGLAAVELGKQMGARVIAAASSADKLALCREYGADAAIDYSAEDLRARVRELTGGRGPDVVYDPVGGPFTEPMVRSLAQGGRHLVLGFAAGDIPRIPLNLVLLKISAIVGAYWGPSIDADPARNAANLAELYAWHAAGRLRPHISETYPLERAGEAVERVAGRRTRGKVVLVI